MEAIYNESSNNRLTTDTESIKLTKNTKGYNWEIKILCLDCDKIEKLNNTMMIKFGNVEND